MPGIEIVLGISEAVMGAIELVQGTVKESSGGLSIKADVGSYPKELADFLKPGTLVNRQILKFVADGFIWNTHLGISMRGAFSNNNDELVCFEEMPGIPSNRYMTDVKFFESPHSETISSTLLEVTVTGYEQPVGTPDNPYLVFHVTGHFDPVGIGDERFSFNLYIDSYGQVTSGEQDCSERLELTDKGDYIEIFLNQ